MPPSAAQTIPPGHTRISLPVTINAIEDSGASSLSRRDWERIKFLAEGTCR